jgi:hypothetical protein
MSQSAPNETNFWSPKHGIGAFMREFCTMKWTALLAILGTIPLNGQALFVGSGAQVTVATGDALYIDDDITNNGSIDLKAASGSYAQLKLTGTYSGSGTFSQQQHLTDGWHLLASPVSNVYNATSNGSTSALYAFNTDLAGGNPGYVAWSTSYNEPDRGFYGKVGAAGNFLSTAGLLTVSGVPNTSTSARSVGLTAAVTSNGSANGSGTGWNLLGNPYPCGLDWYSYQANTSPAILNNAVYIWNPAAGGGAGAYSSYSGYVTGALTIPPMQGFWVQVFYPSGGTLPASTMAAHGTLESATFYKQLPPRLELRIEAIGDSARRDQLVLAHLQGAALAFEGATDAWKLSNGAGMPNLMARDDASGQETSINALDLGAPGVIPVNFRCGTPNEKWAVSVDGDWAGDVLLEDRLLGSFTDLRAGAHQFVHAGWTLDESRFRLHYVPAATLGDGEESVNASLVAYASGEWLVVHSALPASLYTLDGRLVAQSSGGSLLQQIPRPASGLYVVLCGTQRSKILVP